MFGVMYPGVLSVLATSAHWEAIDLPLWNESGMRPDPRLIGIQMLQCILLLMFPFHMLLFVADRIPPDVQETISEDAAMSEERAQVEASAVLGYDKIDRIGPTIANG